MKPEKRVILKSDADNIFKTALQSPDSISETIRKMRKRLAALDNPRDRSRDAITTDLVDIMVEIYEDQYQYLHCVKSPKDFRVYWLARPRELIDWRHLYSKYDAVAPVDLLSPHIETFMRCKGGRRSERSVQRMEEAAERAIKRAMGEYTTYQSNRIRATGSIASKPSSLRDWLCEWFEQKYGQKINSMSRSKGAKFVCSDCQHDANRNRQLNAGPLQRNDMVWHLYFLHQGEMDGEANWALANHREASKVRNL
ncbi:hypothetical protein ABW19_dt0204361 [Dactylella cylindrospora]|nr:hypothetical protein ABW19_dt0204361 [Dactylella cylindrospora]